MALAGIEGVGDAAVEELRDDEAEDQSQNHAGLEVRLEARRPHDVADIGRDDDPDQHQDAQYVLQKIEGLAVTDERKREVLAQALPDDLQSAERDDDEAPEDEEVDDAHALLEELLLSEH